MREVARSFHNISQEEKIMIFLTNTVFDLVYSITKQNIVFLKKVEFGFRFFVDLIGSIYFEEHN